MGVRNFIGIVIFLCLGVWAVFIASQPTVCDRISFATELVSGGGGVITKVVAPFVTVETIKGIHTTTIRWRLLAAQFLQNYFPAKCDWDKRSVPIPSSISNVITEAPVIPDLPAPSRK